jgi:hypothetical protein
MFNPAPHVARLTAVEGGESIRVSVVPHRWQRQRRREPLRLLPALVMPDGTIDVVVREFYSHLNRFLESIR